MIFDNALLYQGFHICRLPAFGRAQLYRVQSLIFIPFIRPPKLTAFRALQQFDPFTRFQASHTSNKLCVILTNFHKVFSIVATTLHNSIPNPELSFSNSTVRSWPVAVASKLYYRVSDGTYSSSTLARCFTLGTGSAFIKASIALRMSCSPG